MVRRSPFRTNPLVLAVLISFGTVSLGHAQEPAGDIFAAARAAVQQQQFDKSAQVGFSIVNTAYSDVPAEGGVLVGFDVQLGKTGDRETVYGLRPIYLTGAGQIATKELGVFGFKFGKKNADLSRSTRVLAPSGYAVGSITLRSGLHVEGLRLTYHRIKGNALDTNDAITSDWIGGSKAGEKILGGKGTPIVGVFGNMDERRVLAVGVYQMRAAAVWPRPKAAPRDAGPKIAAAAPPAEPPARPAGRPVDEPVEKPAAEAPAAPVEEAPAAPAEVIENAADKAPEPAPRAESPDRTVWFALGIVACMAAVGACCWFAFGGNPRGLGLPTLKSKKTPPPIKVDEEVEPARTGKEAPAPVDATAVMVKPAGTFSAKPVPPPSDALADTPAPAKSQPQYFHVRAVYSFKANRFYRVYVMPKMLLFLDAGPESNDQYKNGVGAAGAAAGGILGAVVGHAIGSVIDSTREDSREARQKLLDTAETDELIQLSVEGGVSFRVVPADVQDARIEPTSTWHTMQHLGNQYVGLLCFHHPDHGDMTLEIPTPNDMRQALMLLPAIFGARLAVKVELNRRTWQYVAK